MSICWFYGSNPPCEYVSIVAIITAGYEVSSDNLNGWGKGLDRYYWCLYDEVPKLKAWMPKSRSCTVSFFLSAASPPVSCIVEWRENTMSAMLDVECLSGSLFIRSDKYGFRLV